MTTITLTASQLSKVMPKAKSIAEWLPHLNNALTQFKIDSSPRAAAFLAQIAHESGELSHLVEKLDYTAPRLMVVWPRRFNSMPKALEYEHQPEKLANYVYAKRMGNGDVASG